MDALLELISKQYNINVKTGVKIKNVYKLECDEGIFCFKFSKYKIKEYAFIMSAIDHLEKSGFKHILKRYRTIDGKSFIEVPDGYGYLCDWVDSREADFRNPIELKMCVNTLANMHIASRGFSVENPPRVRNNYGKWIMKFKKRCDEMLYFKAQIFGKDEKSEFDSIYLKYFDSHYNQGLKAVKDVTSSCYEEVIKRDGPKSYICHHDTANHNFLITPDMNMYMVDFDYCIMDTHLHDLGSIIIRSLRHGNWNMETFEYVINNYSKTTPVSPEEVELIFAFMEFPQDFWQIGLQYYVEKQRWTEEIFLKRLQRIIEDVRGRFQFIRGLEDVCRRDLNG